MNNLSHVVKMNLPWAFALAAIFSSDAIANSGRTTELPPVDVIGEYIEPPYYAIHAFDWSNWYDNNYYNDWEGVGSNENTCHALREDGPEGCPENSNVLDMAVTGPWYPNYTFGLNTGIGRLNNLASCWFCGNWVSSSISSALERHTDALRNMDSALSPEAGAQEAHRVLIREIYDICFEMSFGYEVSCFQAVLILNEEAGETDYLQSLGLVPNGNGWSAVRQRDPWLGISATTISLPFIELQLESTNSLQYKVEKAREDFRCYTFARALERNGCIDP